MSSTNGSTAPNKSVYTEHWLTGPQSTNFYCRVYPAQTQLDSNSTSASASTPTSSITQPRAILVFLHGFIEHIGRYSHVFPNWSARGIHVFAFDQRGFGKTSGIDGSSTSKDGAAIRSNKDVSVSGDEDGGAEGGSSKNSSYAKTSGAHQVEDLEWAVKTAREWFSGSGAGKSVEGGEGEKELPVFVMGHSMGGGIVLDFATKTKQRIAGIIASSPLILQTNPASKIARWVGGKASLVTPYSTIPAQVKAEHLSKDQEKNEAYLKDPLIKQKGSLRGISDMLNRGEELLQSLYKHWPEHLPLLIVHGTGDKVTSHAASQRFHDAVPAKDKKISLYDNGFHELHNEPDGVKDRFIDECISWVEARLPLHNSNPASSATTISPSEPSPNVLPQQAHSPKASSPPQEAAIAKL